MHRRKLCGEASVVCDDRAEARAKRVKMPEEERLRAVSLMGSDAARLSSWIREEDPAHLHRGKPTYWWRLQSLLLREGGVAPWVMEMDAVSPWQDRDIVISFLTTQKDIVHASRASGGGPALTSNEEREKLQNQCDIIRRRANASDAGVRQSRPEPASPPVRSRKQLAAAVPEVRHCGYVGGVADEEGDWKPGVGWYRGLPPCYPTADSLSMARIGRMPRADPGSLPKVQLEDEERRFRVPKGDLVGDFAALCPQTSADVWKLADRTRAIWPHGWEPISSFARNALSRTPACGAVVQLGGWAIVSEEVWNRNYGDRDLDVDGWVQIFKQAAIPTFRCATCCNIWVLHAWWG